MRKFIFATLFTIAAVCGNATTYYWKGSSGGEWANKANWTETEGGSDDASAYPNSVADAEAIFTSDASVVLNTADITISNLTLNANVTISGTKYLMINGVGDSNDTTKSLTLSNATFKAYQGKTGTQNSVEYPNPIVIAEDTINYILTHGYGTKASAAFTVSGAISGSGDLLCGVDANNSNHKGGVRISGDMSAFQGTIAFNATQKISTHGIAVAVNAPQSKWYVFTNGVEQCLNPNMSSDSRYHNQNGFFRAENNSAYVFGALNGCIGAWEPSGNIDKSPSGYGAISTSSLTVGNLNEDCSVYGDWNGTNSAARALGSMTAFSPAATFNWVATSATLTYCVTNTANMNITGGGKVVFPTADGTPQTTIAVTGEGGTINPASDISSIFSATAAFGIEVSADKSVKFANALPATGLTKSGDGALTLSSAVAGGAVTVSAGTLSVPGGTISTLSIASGATLAFTGSSALEIDAAGDLDGSITASSGTIYVPYGTDGNASLISAIQTALGDSAGNVTIEYTSITGTIALTPSEDELPAAFSSGTAFSVTTCSLKAGDTIMVVKGDRSADGYYTWTFLSPNTGTTSVFYGTPTAEYDEDTGYTTFTAAYASNATIWDGTSDTIEKDPLIIASDYTWSSEKKSPNNILFLADATFSGPATLTISNGKIWEGTGKVVFAGAKPRGNGTGTWNVYNPVEFTSTASMTAQGGNSSGLHTVYFHGSVTVDSALTLNDDTSSKPGAVVFGGAVAGSGSIATSWNQSSSYVQFNGGDSDFSNLSVSLGDTGNASPLITTAGTYTFGSLSGKVTGGSEDVMLVVNGGTSIAYTKGTSDWNLTYGAAKKLTVTGDNFGVYTLASKLGSIAIPSAITDSQLGENTKRSDSDELLLVTSLEFTEEELLELKQIQVDDDCITNIAPNTVAAAISASWDIAEPVAIEGAGGLDFGEYTLTLSDDGILVLNPPRSSIKLTSAPTLSGGKFALASEYKNCTCGQFILCSWTDGSSLSFPSDQDTIFTNTTSATSYLLEETTDGDIKRLVLTLGDYKTSPVKAFTLLPIGDSITEGAEKTSGDVSIPNYRIPLCEKLAAAGYDVTTLGYLRTKCVDASGVNAPAQWTSHSGRGGEKLIWYPSTSGHDRGAVREAIDALLDQAGSADIVTLKLGTNDIQHEKDSGNFDEDVYIASLTNVIWKILNYAPKTKVVVSTLLDLTAYNSELPDKCNEKIRGLFADGNEYGFPENRVFLADNYTYVPRYVNSVYQNTYLSSSNVHPNWKGHDLFSDGWFVAVTNALATGETSGDRTACTTTGAANNVPAAYTNGFTQAATLDLANDGKFYLAPNTAPTYTTTNADAPTNKLGRIAYYLELKRKDNNSDEHVRWVWVDIPAFGDRTLAACGFPGNYSKFGQVSGVHIVSNDGAIHQVAADDDTCTARLEFTYHGYSGASSGDEDAPADMNSRCDWNDTESTSSNYGSFQIHRILDDGEFFSNPAEVVFAFNKWSKGSSCTNEVGIGNFAQHTAGTSIDYTGTDAAIMTNMNACAYEVINLEIWTKPAEYVWTGEDETDDNWSTAANWKYLDDGETASEYPNGEANTVYFPATNSTCVLDVDATVADMVIEEGDSATLDDQEALTLSGDGTHTLTIKSAQNCYQGKNRKVIYDGAKVKFGNKYGRMGVALRSSTSSASSGTMIVKGSSEITVQTLYACGSDAWIYIDGGTVTVTSDMQVNNGGHIVISNGTVTANSLVRTKGSGSSEIEIYGGSVSIAKLALSNGGALTIDGGSVTINAIDGTIADSSSITVSESATMTFKDSTVASTFLSAVDEFEMTTRTITRESDQSTVDATSYYVLAPDATGTGTSVTLADDVVAEIEDGTTALAGTGIPSFTVPSDNVKKGLYYGLSAATSPDETSVLAETQATSDGETITLTPGSLDFSSSNVYYFRFTTSDEAQKE